jgi:hypothetical protein
MNRCSPEIILYSLIYKMRKRECRQAPGVYTRAIEATKDKNLSSLCYYVRGKCEEHY